MLFSSLQYFQSQVYWLFCALFFYDFSGYDLFLIYKFYDINSNRKIADVNFAFVAGNFLFR